MVAKKRDTEMRLRVDKPETGYKDDREELLNGYRHPFLLGS